MDSASRMAPSASRAISSAPSPVSLSLTDDIPKLLACVTPPQLHADAPPPNALKILLIHDAASLCGLYEDRDIGLFAAARNDANTDFDWHAGTGIPELAAANSFKTYWYGDFVAPVSGTYTFYTIHNNGVRFYFNNKLIIVTAQALFFR